MEVVVDDFRKGGKDEMKKALEIGCGIDPKIIKGYDMTYLDYTKRKIPKGSKLVVFNLNKVPLPFEDNAFDLIIADNVLEHLLPATTEKELWLERFNEFYRILKPNGILRVMVPHYTNGFIMEHRVNFSTWNIIYIFETKDNWVQDLRRFNFKIKLLRLSMNTFWSPISFILNRSRILMEIWEKYLCYIIRAKEITFELEKVA